MQVETRFVWLFRQVEIGDDLNGWEVCWLGGWDPCRVMFVAMVKQVMSDGKRRDKLLDPKAVSFRCS